MLQLKQILVPVDFSARSLIAAKRAALLAKRFASQLTLVHVIDRFPYEGTEMEAFYGEHGEVISGKELDSRFHNKLHEFAAKVESEVSPREVLLKGDPAREIEKFVSGEKTDLVVIPTRGYGSFRKFLLGSVAAKILHDVRCPVLTGVHMEEETLEKPAPYQRIGCAVDLADHSEALLRWAAGFAEAWNSDVVLIHATPMVEVLVDSPHFVAVDWRDMVTRAAGEKLGRLIKKVGVQAEICVGHGHPVHFVTSAASEQKLDLLVIGRGQAQKRASRLPTHAYGMIREAPCPVVSLT